MSKALYSFFTLQPSIEQHLAIIDSGGSVEFTYPHLLMPNCKYLKPLSAEYVKYFVDYRNHQSTEQSDKLLNLQNKIYGEYDEKLFWEAIHYVRQKALSCQKSDKYYDAAQSIVNSWPINNKVDSELFSPIGGVFSKYKRYFDDIFNGLFEELLTLNYENSKLFDLFDLAILYFKLDTKGWSVKEANIRSNSMVSITKKRFIVPNRQILSLTSRVKQVIVHELVHALIAENGGLKGQFQNKDEGLCLVAEQLVSERFKYKRLFRYLAIGFGSGVDGKKRTLNETYLMLVPALRFFGRCGLKTAQYRALIEARRAYSGGDPNRAGFVFIKDKRYLQENIDCWKIISKKELTYNAFKEIMGLL